MTANDVMKHLLNTEKTLVHQYVFCCRPEEDRTGTGSGADLGIKDLDAALHSNALQSLFSRSEVEFAFLRYVGTSMPDIYGNSRALERDKLNLQKRI